MYLLLQRYLAPNGLVLMVSPKPRHRHCVEQLRTMLLGSASRDGLFAATVGEVPLWATHGLDEAADVQHELIVAQWRSSVL